MFLTPILVFIGFYFNWSFFLFLFIFIFFISSSSSFFFSFLFESLLFLMLLWCVVASMVLVETKTMEVFLLLSMVPTFFFFLSNNSLIMFISFEMTLFPIMLMIMVYGIQAERLISSFYLLIYTMTSSMPFMISLIWLDLFSISSGLESSLTPFQFFLCSVAFFVKMPCWIFHSWLPKAHVESPTIGSMILAGVMLKLGVFGLFRLSKMSTSSVLWLTLSICLCGALLGAFLSLLQSDVKKMVAFSSISHMSYLVFCLFLIGNNSKIISMMLIMSHAIASSMLFLMVGEISHMNLSRNLLIMNMVESVSSVYKMQMFCVCSSNMGTPGTVQFFPEMLSLYNLYDLKILGVCGGVLYLLFVCYLSIFLFMSMKQQTSNNTVQMFNIFQMFNMFLIFSI